MPSMVSYDAVEAKGKGYLLLAMQVFLWIVVAITVWGIGSFALRMLGLGR